MDCSPPGSSVHGISQARILEWVAISYSRGSFLPSDQTRVSCMSLYLKSNHTKSRIFPDTFCRCHEDQVCTCPLASHLLLLLNDHCRCLILSRKIYCQMFSVKYSLISTDGHLSAASERFTLFYIQY